MLGFLDTHPCGALVTDFDPLRIKRRWKDEVKSRVPVPLYEVDAHNIVPCWTASGKQEWAAYTFRPKIKRALPEYFGEFPAIVRHPFEANRRPDEDHPQSGKLTGHREEPDWEGAAAGLKAQHSVAPVRWIAPGAREARAALAEFIDHRLPRYHLERNDPNADAVSGLSPYLHFGQLSAQRVALEVARSSASDEAKEAFLEESIVRRELSDNFCYYNRSYDRVESFPAWAQKTLGEHRRDAREYRYSLEELEEARTHDPLWNAAQREMTVRGKMHGYMRMYWGKKILEWSAHPEAALEAAIYLNDRYELDGRDPNGYAGIAWSIGGVHDRPWFDRPIFGKVRYMSYNGCRSKFDVNAYIARIDSYR
jgi:deoxyribodipyrimidine photo-lyase